MMEWVKALPTYLYYGFRFSIILATNLYGIPCYLVWMLLLLPLRLLSWSLYWTVEAVLFKGLLSIVVIWFSSANYCIIETGDDISRLSDEGVVLLVNHQSTADTPLTMVALQGKGLAGGRVMWIMDHIFRFTHFGLVSMLRGDFFIMQGKDTRQLQLVGLQSHLEDVYLPRFKQWIILFPEGGFLHKRREGSQKYAQKYGYPVLEHVTLPRTGALKVILDMVGVKADSHSKKQEPDTEAGEGRVKWVVDMTIAYPEGRPLDLLSLGMGSYPPCQLVLHYRAYPAVTLPGEEEELRQWLYQRYVEKEAMLEDYYQRGQLPGSVDSERRLLPRRAGPLVADNVHVLLFNVFYLLSAYLFIVHLIQPVFAFLF